MVTVTFLISLSLTRWTIWGHRLVAKCPNYNVIRPNHPQVCHWDFTVVCCRRGRWCVKPVWDDKTFHVVVSRPENKLSVCGSDSCCWLCFWSFLSKSRCRTVNVLDSGVVALSEEWMYSSCLPLKLNDLIIMLVTPQYETLERKSALFLPVQLLLIVYWKAKRKEVVVVCSVLACDAELECILSDNGDDRTCTCFFTFSHQIKSNHVFYLSFSLGGRTQRHWFTSPSSVSSTRQTRRVMQPQTQKNVSKQKKKKEKRSGFALILKRKNK